MNPEIERYFSSRRLAPYLLPGESADVAFNRYQWNLRLAEALLPSLSYLEVGLRNSLNAVIRWSAFASALADIANKPVSGESTLSKTTKAYARKLLNESTIKILLSQAMREKSGSGKRSSKMHVR